MKPFIKTNLVDGLLVQPAKKGQGLAAAVIAAAREVHRHLGPGFTREIYEEALCTELNEARIPFERRREVGVLYKNWPIGQHRLPLLVDGAVIVEALAAESLTSNDRARMIAWLKAANLSQGVLLNFNVPALKSGIQRVCYRENETGDWSYARNAGQ